VEVQGTVLPVLVTSALILPLHAFALNVATAITLSQFRMLASFYALRIRSQLLHLYWIGIGRSTWSFRIEDFAEL